MMSSSTFGGMSYGWHLHWIFGLAIAIGVVLLIIWAARTLKADQLKTWVIWLLVIGVIGSFLTSGMGWSGMHGSWGGMHGKNINWQTMGQHMQSDDHSELTTPEEWREHMKEEMKEYMNY
jgi:asparagine N-glycosylation enzyme membrane subunit Stt3